MWMEIQTGLHHDLEIDANRITVLSDIGIIGVCFFKGLEDKNKQEFEQLEICLRKDTNEAEILGQIMMSCENAVIIAHLLLEAVQKYKEWNPQ